MWIQKNGTVAAAPGKTPDQTLKAARIRTQEQQDTSGRSSEPGAAAGTPRRIPGLSGQGGEGHSGDRMGGSGHAGETQWLPNRLEQSPLSPTAAR